MSSLQLEGLGVPSKTLLTVPFEDRLKAKELGAKWDAEAKTWYIPQFCRNHEELLGLYKHKNPIYLRVAFEDKDEAQKLGARWAATAGIWYLPAHLFDTKIPEHWN